MFFLRAALLCLVLALIAIMPGKARALPTPTDCAIQTGAAIGAFWAVQESKRIAQLAGANLSNAISWYSPGNDAFIAGLRTDVEKAVEALKTLEAAFAGKRTDADTMCFDPRSTFNQNCGIRNIGTGGSEVTVFVGQYDPVSIIQKGVIYQTGWYERPPDAPVTIVPLPCEAALAGRTGPSLLANPPLPPVVVTPPPGFTFASLLPPTDPATGKLRPPTFGPPRTYIPTANGYVASAATAAITPLPALPPASHSPASRPGAPQSQPIAIPPPPPGWQGTKPPATPASPPQPALRPPASSPAPQASIVGCWMRTSDQSVVQFTPQGTAIVGRINALGTQIARFGFTVGEQTFQLTRSAGSTFYGQVKWRNTQGQQWWQATTDVVVGNQMHGGDIGEWVRQPCGAAPPAQHQSGGVIVDPPQ